MSSPLDGARSIVSLGVSGLSGSITSLPGGDRIVSKSDFMVSRDLMSFWSV